jgi:uncharacterized membrane protein YgcG
MAKTTTKRRRKHRGTQAGTIAPVAESRSRGAKAAAAGPADKAAARGEARRRRAESLDKPPTWRGAINRAAIAAVIVAVLAVLALGNSPAQAVVLAAVMLVVYIPLGYGFDTLVYRMRQRRKGRSAASGPGGDSGRGRDARRG